MRPSLPPLSDGDPFTRSSPWEISAYRPSLNLLALAPERDKPLPTVHELSHFFEHCSTPFGFFRDEMHLRQLLLFQEFLKCLPGTVPVPVYTWASQALDDAGLVPQGITVTEFCDLVEKYIRPWSICTRLLQVLDGSRAEKIRSALAIHEADYVAESESPFPFSQERESYPPPPRLNHSDATLTACPSCTWVDDQTVAFGSGAEHVSEAIAQVQEGLEACLGCKDEWKYLALPLMVIERIGPERYSHMQRHAYVTTLTIGDLALCTPIGRYYGRLRPSGAVWEDIHPGHRFQRALAAIADDDHWICNFADAEPLANAICDKFGWTRPRSFFELGASNDHPRAVRHKDACRLRLANYMVFYELSQLANEGSVLGSFFERHMPITLYPGRGAVCCYPDGHTEPVVAIEQIRDLYVSGLCRRVMLDGLAHDTPIFPRTLNLGYYIENIATEHEFASVYAEGHPWARLERFLPFR